MEKIFNLFEDSGWVDAKEYPTGTKEKVLFDDHGMKTLLLKLPKGFFMDAHAHLYTEQHIVMQGSYTSEGKTYDEGTYRSFNAHENHGPFKSDTGALVLVVWTPYQPE